MTTKQAPWFGRVLKWHKMAHGHACAYRGRVHTIVKPEGATCWHFTVDPDDPAAPPSNWCGGPGLARSLERSRPLAEAMLLVDRADRMVGDAPNFLLALGSGRPVFGGLVVWTDADQGLLRICRDLPWWPGEERVPGPLVATVQPVFGRGGQILHWRTSGPDGAHWDNTAYWREACRVVESRC